MKIDLTGKISVVTGGGSGIGFACARTLVDCGSTVVVIDVEADRQRDVERIGAIWYRANAHDEALIETAAESIEKDYGPVDILVTSAGILQPRKSPEQLHMLVWDEVQRVNVRATYICCRAFGTRMAQREGGSIVTIASVAGLSSAPLHSYAPAKAAVVQLTTCLAAEWGGQNVRVNCVAPGFTDTPALARGFKKRQLAAKKINSANCLGRLIEPAEIAASVVFLASNLSSATTGVTLPVDCGFLAAAGWQAYEHADG